MMTDERVLEALLDVLEQKAYVIDEDLVREVLSVAVRHQFDADRSVGREAILSAVTAFVDRRMSVEGT